MGSHAPTLWSERGSATSVGGMPRSGSYIDDLEIVIKPAHGEPLLSRASESCFSCGTRAPCHPRWQRKHGVSSVHAMYSGLAHAELYMYISV